MISETVWFAFTIWAVLLAFGLKERIIGAFGSFAGLLFGLILITEISFWIGIIIIFLNFYLLYKAMFGGKK